MANENIRISLDVATQAAERALANMRKNVEETDKTFQTFKGNFAAGLALGGIATAFNALSGFVSTFIDEAAGSEQAIQRLNQALKSTGQFTPKASQDFQDFAGALQNTSIYADEAILSNASLLLSLTNLDKDGIKQATQAAADLAATLNISLDEATTMIAKAVNGNTTAFKKLGYEIQTSNTDAGRLTNVLSALSSQQGAASAATETFAGAMAKAKNQQSESFESLGKLITQHPVVIAGIKGISDAFTTSASIITENKQFISDLATTLVVVGGAIIAATTALKLYTIASASTIVANATLAATLAGTSVAWGVVAAASRAAWLAITGPVGAAVLLIAAVGTAVYALVKYWDDVKAGAYEALAATLEFAAKGAAVFSEDRALILQAQAQGYREQAFFIKEAAKAAREKAEQDKKNDQESEEQRKAREKREADARKEADAQAAFISANKRINLANLRLMEEEHNQSMSDLGFQYGLQRAEQEGTLTTEMMTRFNADNEARLAKQQEFDRRELELQIQKATAKAMAETDEKKREDELRDIRAKANLDRIALENKQELAMTKLKYDGQAKLDREMLAAKTNTMNLFTSMSSSKSKELAAIGKAAGLYQIAVATPVAVGDAFKWGNSVGGPVVGFTFGAIAAAAMADQAAQLAGLNFANGGIVPGTSYSGDRVQANVNSGEMVLNRQQQRRLFDVADGKEQVSGGITPADLAAFAKSIMSTPIVVEIDGRQLVGVFRDQLASGRTT